MPTIQRAAAQVKEIAMPISLIPSGFRFAVYFFWSSNFRRLELLVDSNCVTPEKLSFLRRECDELIAIFVTILKRSKEIS